MAGTNREAAQAAGVARQQRRDDFWQRAGDWWGGITGKTQKTAGTDLMNRAANVTGTIAGTSEADQMAAAQKASSGLAEQQGQTAATQGSRAALRSARTSGLNAGQAALTSGQQAGDLFTGGYQGGMQQGMNQYGQATQNRLNAAGQQGALGQAQQAAGQQQSQGFWQGIGNVAGIGASLLSDREAKTDIRDAQTVDRAADAIPSKTFRYKEGGGPHVGVIAQDVEKVVPENVHDTPAGKTIDVAKQTGTNTAWILEAVRRLRDVERKVGA